MLKLPVVIVGAGPAGLIAAQRLADAGFEVHVYEQNKAAARKFLVAGHGGFNLTHSEDIDRFVQNYDKPLIQDIVRYFDNQATVSWLEQLGVPTFVGSSGKIFPDKGIKPIQVLQALLEKLVEQGVQLHYGFRMVDFDGQKVTFDRSGEPVEVGYQNLILGLGGGSWHKTGSDAKWIDILNRKAIRVVPLQPANSGLQTRSGFARLAGEVLKNISLKFEEHRKKGEIVLTTYGIEGAPVYYLNRFIRQLPFPLTLGVDLKPSYSLAFLRKELEHQGNMTDLLRNKIKLSPVAIRLLKLLDKATFVDPASLAKAIKDFPIEVTAFRPIDEVISTAGGVSFDALDASLSLKKYPNVFCVGEMLDWEAPTGGYLLQACFSSGVWAAEHIKKQRI